MQMQDAAQHVTENAMRDVDMPPGRQAEIELNQELERLERLVHEFTGRVGFVLRADTQVEGPSLSTPGPSPSTSGFHDTLAMWAERVRSLNVHLGYALERVDV